MEGGSPALRRSGKEMRSCSARKLSAAESGPAWLPSAENGRARRKFAAQEKGQVKVSAEAASQAAQDKQADLVKKLEHQKDAVKAAQLLQVTREGLLKKAQKSKTVFDKDNKY